MRDVREGGTQRTGPMRLQWLEPGAPRCGVWHRRSPRARVAPLCSDPGRSGQRETEGIGITTAGVLSRSARDLQNERSGTADPRDGSGLCGKVSQHPTAGCLFTHDTGQEQRCWSARFRYIKGGVSAWLLSCLRRTLAFGIGGRGGGGVLPPWDKYSHDDSRGVDGERVLGKGRSHEPESKSELSEHCV